MTNIGLFAVHKNRLRIRENILTFSENTWKESKHTWTRRRDSWCTYSPNRTELMAYYESTPRDVKLSISLLIMAQQDKIF